MIFFLLLASVCSLFSLVFALPIVPRDVWDPPITSPAASTVWTAGGTYTVTWSTSNEPAQVTNPNGSVYLRHNDATQSTPLAQDFLLTDGSVKVTIPSDTEPGGDWILVLFGDSGNWSPPFTIVGPSS